LAAGGSLGEVMLAKSHAEALMRLSVAEAKLAADLAVGK
jgi:hypothetical protein